MENINNTVFDKLIDSCIIACNSNIPILYLLTDEFKLADDILNSGKLVAKRALVKYLDGTSHFVPYDEYKIEQERIDKEIGSNIKNTYEPNTVNYKEGINCFDNLITPDIRKHAIPSIGIVKNFNLYISTSAEESTIGQKMASHIYKYFSQEEKHKAYNKSVILLVAPTLIIPKGLEQYVEVIEVNPPEEFEIKDIILKFNNRKNDNGENISKEYLDKLIENLKGFNESKIIALLNRIIIEADFLTNHSKMTALKKRGLPIDIPYNQQPEYIAINTIIHEKEQMLKKSGVLTWEKRKDVEVGGLELLIEWINKKKELLENYNEAVNNWSIEFPKGILVCGIPGSGKSLMAQKTAQLFDIPLIKMDMGLLMGKYLGESEKNMHNALRMAQAISPCVLWIDELEKAFSGVSSGSEDSASLKRTFASFLTWMQENETPCFIFATANDISSMPAEFLRRGRFDQKFYVFMPLKNECIKIFQAEMNKRLNKSLKNQKDNNILFSNEILNDNEFFGEIVDYCVQGDNRKFLTGSDITGIINDAFIDIYSKKRNTHNDNKNNPAINTTRVTKGQIKESIKQVIKGTRTYGETDLKNIAKSYITLWEKKFNPASEKVLFSYSDYDNESKIAIKAEKNRNSKEYDDILFNAIRDEINRISGKNATKNNN